MPTYKQFKKFLRDKCWNERDYGEWIYDKLIYDFLVEEVKENKEDVLSVKQENPHDKIKIVTEWKRLVMWLMSLTDDKGRIEEMEKILTQLKPCKHESDWDMYLSYPPQWRCKKCWEFYRL